ncbi:MAG: hypothetical protein U9N51_11045 [Bacteroidota bacterium]|nr:hypothetical protein [Bacteroidota bacterium]
MKKLSIFAIAAVFGLFAVSCNNGEETTDEGTKTEDVKTDLTETQDDTEVVADELEEDVTTQADENAPTDENVVETEDEGEEKPKAQEINQVKIDKKEVAKKGDTEEKDNEVQR